MFLGFCESHLLEAITKKILSRPRPAMIRKTCGFDTSESPSHAVRKVDGIPASRLTRKNCLNERLERPAAYEIKS